MKKSTGPFYAGVAFLISLASFLYAWKLIIPKYNENKVALATIDSEIGSASKKLESLKTASKTLASLGEIPEQLSLAVPEDKDMPNLITELEALAAKNNIIIPAIQVTEGSGSGTGTSNNGVSVSFAVSGSFEEINNLIASLEKDIRFMNIKSVSISSGDEGSMSLSLQLEAYKRGAKAEVTAGTSSASTPASTSSNTGANINAAE